jgi:hypothetical protein
MAKSEVEASISKKLIKTSFNSLSKLGVDWRSLILSNKDLAKQLKEYLELKSEYILVNL